ncbi:MAG TPA: 6-carboxytetrahydropterin synthase QueD [Bryobacteraceae bacterium]|nr:6-carboxytetrahydropterin synthase QueD [Bryobacteraceae bacterium]
MFEVTIEETFAAGHALRNYHGKCENVHGHNYRCQVTIHGPELDSIGLLVDFVELKKVVHAVLDRLDHQWLNEFPPFDVLNPSAENMARYIYDEINQGLGTRPGVSLGSVRLWETDTAFATYRPGA